MGENSNKNLVIVGSNGMLAQAVRRFAPGGYRIICLDLPQFDLTDRNLVLEQLKKFGPAVIVNCAAYTNVDGCETNEEVASLVNGKGPGYLAEAALSSGATLVHISTDYVFDGKKIEPYTEEDSPNPLSVYGRSKLQGEHAILGSGLKRFFIIRTSWLYGAGGKNFVETIVRLAKEREELRIVCDQFGSPTFTDDLAQAIFNLTCLEKTGSSGRIPYGIYHFSNSGACSWYEFANDILAQMVLFGERSMAQRIFPISTAEFPLPAVRPANSVLSKEKYRRATGAEIPNWRVSLATYFRSRKG